MNIDLYIAFLHNYLNNNNIKFNTKLIINNDINETMSDSTTDLQFGNDFNQKLTKGVIPNSVTHLTFVYGFNQVLKKELYQILLLILFLDINLIRF